MKSVSVRLFCMIYFRTKSQYGYRNETTGIIQWDYPVMDAQPIEKEDNDDEMDICTTPPPNANEILPEINNLNGILVKMKCIKFILFN